MFQNNPDSETKIFINLWMDTGRRKLSDPNKWVVAPLRFENLLKWYKNMLKGIVSEILLMWLKGNRMDWNKDKFSAELFSNFYYCGTSTTQKVPWKLINSPHNKTIRLTVGDFEATFNWEKLNMVSMRSKQLAFHATASLYCLIK